MLQGFTTEQIQQLAKTVYSLNNNGKSDMFINVAGLFVHNSYINSAFTKPWILDGGTNHIASDSQFFTHTSSHCRTWLWEGWLARVNNTQAYTTCPLFQTKPTHLQFRPTLIYGTNASNILLRRIYNLHLHYYLSVKISFLFIIIVVFVPKLKRQGCHFLSAQ